MTSFRRFYSHGGVRSEEITSTDQRPYGRVTAPERFAALHTLGEATLQRLADTYAVDRAEGSAIDPELAGVPGIGRLVRLTPADSMGAPLTVGFLAFPGLVVRAGRWHQAVFPGGGCDACGEDPAEVGAAFTDLVAAVVAGSFQEAIELPWIGSAWLTHAYGHADDARGRRAGRRVVSRTTARAYLRANGAAAPWGAWVARGTRPP